MLPSLDADMCHQGQQADVPDLQGREVRRHEACLRMTLPYGYSDPILYVDDITLLLGVRTALTHWHPGPDSAAPQ